MYIFKQFNLLNIFLSNFKKSTTMSMAVCGHNGNNETIIGTSALQGLSIYDDNLNEISIVESSIPIDIIIPRDPNLTVPSFQYVNATSFGLMANNQYLPNCLNITIGNVSLHIEIKPFNFNIGYIVIMKLGYTPIVNSTYADYTSFKIICPSKIIFKLFHN